MTDHDFTWIADHSSELFKKYRGKWIAVRDGCVVGVGDTAPQAAEKARQQVPDGEFILEAIDEQADVIYVRPQCSVSGTPRRSIEANSWRHRRLGVRAN